LRPFLSLSGITKSYGDNVILQDLSLEVNQGEFFFLLGPSGCGKTTLLKIISGLMFPDSGQIKLNGSDITQIPSYKRDVNTVFQNYALFPHMNVFDNIAFGLRMKKVNEKDIRIKVNEALRLVALSDFASRKPGQLSGGQMQRVALARAFVNEPAVLLLDEPLGALDVKLRKQMQIELKQIQRELGTTFICVTHDQEEALTMGDRIAVMNEGRFEQIGDANTIYNYPKSYFVSDFLGECNFLSVTSIKSEPEFDAVKFENTILKALRNSAGNMSKVGDKKVFAIRPEKIRTTNGSKKSAVSNDDTNQLRVKVEDIIFTGNLFTLVVATDSGTQLKVSIHNKRNEEIPLKGDQISLEWSSRDSLILDCDK
jgi:spermidine/putrescine transport system ATP-binding protein